MKVQLEHIYAQHPASPQDGAFSLQDISLSIQSGEHIALIGPSGSGKTTLLQVIAAALKPQSGIVRLDELNPWNLSVGKLQEFRSQLFYAPQIPPLPPRQRVITALSASRLPELSLLESLANLIYPQFAREGFEVLSAFDLKDKLWQRVDRLSGGERQRVGLAKVLMSHAGLWLVDEPLSALDPKRSKQAIQTLIAEAHKRRVTLIVTLHQVDVATQEFPRVIGLQNGRLAFDQSAQSITPTQLRELYAQNQHELTHLINEDEVLSQVKSSCASESGLTS